MTTMNEHLERYLAQREAFGTGLSYSAENVLRNFAAFATTVGQGHVTTDLFLCWKEQCPPAGTNAWSRKLSHVRVFARWLQSLDPACEVPPKGLMPKNNRRPVPYIYSDEEITTIVTEAVNLPSVNGLRGPTCSTLFGLLAVTGLRPGEAIGLDDGDVDITEGVLHVRYGKNGNQRVIPITPCTAERLVTYQRLRDNVLIVTSETSLFRSWQSGRRIGRSVVKENFVRVGQNIGLREKPLDKSHGTGPRLYDLRHTFATRTIIEWLRTGRDPDREIYKLTNFLGHRRPSDTFWYLEAVPEIMILTMRQAENVIGYGRES